ncbi:MAG TPA: GNAT family N-acetyltransferase [Longimicrobium sp.]|nr:GNAT family N-acetyltransferase [Longimicrobium sp.]
MAARLRVLTAEDAPAYLEVRLRALREHPEAFATSAEEAALAPLADVARRLAPGPEHVTVGAFDGDRLAGVATVVRATRAKERHRATVAAMYVAPEARGRGLGEALLRRALDAVRAWGGVTDVGLAVTAGNDGARALYARAGFVSWGVEPRALFVDGRHHDTEWMALRLDAEDAERR